MRRLIVRQGAPGGADPQEGTAPVCSAKMSGMEPLAINPQEPAALLAGIDALVGGAAVRAAAATVEESVWLVGGAVRDLLLGVRPRELDLVAEGDPAPLIAALGGEVRDRHERFGTATLALDGGTPVDVAMARAETYAAPGALPDVEPAPLAVDLHRRDVTLNAIAINLETGELAAPATGLDDLCARRLRVLHPNSFHDDPTRLWRLARYEVRLGADWDDLTWLLAQNAVAAGALNTVSSERLGRELRLALGEPDPIGALAAGGRVGVAPRLDLDAERLHQAQLLLPEARQTDIVLACVATDDPALATQLGSADEHRIIAAALALRVAAEGPRGLPLPSDAPGSRIDARFAGLPEVAVASAPDLDAAARWLRELRHRQLAISGEDLLAAGQAEGAEIGRGLGAARAALLDDVVHVDDADAQLRIALAAAC